MSQEIVKFNVGGTHYETSLSTLKNVPDNMLLRMVESPLEKGERIFIDRDGQLFAHILNYLRDVSIWTAPGDLSICAALVREASFYCLFNMKKGLEAIAGLEIKTIEKNPLHEKYPVVTIIAHQMQIIMINTDFPLKLRLGSPKQGNDDISVGLMEININIMEKAGYKLIATVKHPEKSYSQIHYIFSSNL